MKTFILVAPPLTSNQMNPSLTGPSYNFKQVFDIKPFLINKEPTFKNNFFFITSENFLTKSTTSNKIMPLSQQEFYQANTEIQNCANNFTNAIFLTHSYLQSNSGLFSDHFFNDIKKWSRISNETLFPYSLVSTTDSDRLNKVRNIASNLPSMGINDYVYSLSSAYLSSESKARLKGCQIGNYEYGAVDPTQTVKDILNLNQGNYAFIESMSPYFANGYPNSLVDFQSTKAYLMIGEDSINLWDTSKIDRYLTEDLTDSPLIIQADSASGNAISADSGVTPHTFFKSLFNVPASTSLVTFQDSQGQATTTMPYPKTIKVTPPSSTEAGSSLVKAQSSMLSFLNQVPYIVFADTLGYDPQNDAAINPKTVGAIYTCSPGGGTPSTTYTFTRRDDFISGTDTRSSLNSSSASAVYTIYSTF